MQATILNFLEAVETYWQSAVESLGTELHWYEYCNTCYILL